MKHYTALIILVLMAAFCTVPVMGTDQFIGGSPQMTAYISGINEFSPGQDATITVVIQNGGTSAMKFVDHNTLSQDDLPTTALLVTAGLSGNTTPIIVKTDPQNLGDIGSPGIVTATFAAKITSNATLGDYQLPLTLSYRYLANSNSPQPSADTVESQYNDVTTVIPLTIAIKPEVKIEVLDIIPGNLVVGTEGYLNLTIKNIGPEDGKKASVILLRNGDSGVIPSDSSVYIGDFLKNQTVSCMYKVSVSGDSQPQSYSIDVMVTYTNTEGDTVDSATETIGVPVGSKLDFEVTSAPASISPGQSKSIEVKYRNIGSITAYNALARLTTVTPLSSSDTMAYLGDVAPGQTVTALYTISVDSKATPATYNLDTNVRYRDSLDNSLTSDTVSAQVEVIPSAPGSMIPVLAAVILIAAILIIAGYYTVGKRRLR
ncbi:COG1361 S-layer family protein [Methanoregula sp.]|uniref:COG1361 S-layer family protein n=1 Tax=Methanoregula sp. TaxID=2052170 RepID=UPI003C77B4A3